MSPAAVFQLLSAAFLIPLTIGLVVWKRHSLVQRWIVIFLMGTGVLTLMQIGAIYTIGSNWALLHLAPPMEMLFFCFILKHSFPRASWTRIFPVLAGSFVLFCVSSLFLFQSLDTIPSIPRTLQVVIMTLLTLFWYFYQLKNLYIKQIKRSAFFWFSVGVLIYYPCNALIFLYYDSLQKVEILQTVDMETILKIQMIHTVLQLLFYLFLTIALLCKEPPLTSSRAS